MANVEPTPPITGADGELIQRFLAALAHEPSGTRLWSSKLALIIGGQLDGPLGSLHLDIGSNDAATLAEALREGRKSVDLPTYLAEIENRLRELVRSGLTESFLVVAARDHLTAFVDRMANIHAFDVQHAEQREDLQRLIEAGDADDETIAGYRSLLEVLQPLPAEEAIGLVADQSGWPTASSLISDEVVDDWVALRLQRALRRQE